jgi:hypothetical protein
VHRGYEAHRRVSPRRAGSVAGSAATIPDGPLEVVYASPRADRTTVFAIDAEGDSVEPVIVNMQPGWVALFTEIQVFEEIVLADYDSGLTSPEILWDLSGAARSDAAIAFRYVLDRNPGSVSNASKPPA